LAAAEGEQDKAKKQSTQIPRQPFVSRFTRALLSWPQGCHKGRWYFGCQYADSISRHWPESSIKSSQANAGGECYSLRAMRRQAVPPSHLPVLVVSHVLTPYLWGAALRFAGDAALLSDWLAALNVCTSRARFAPYWLRRLSKLLNIAIQCKRLTPSKKLSTTEGVYILSNSHE